MECIDCQAVKPNQSTEAEALLWCFTAAVAVMAKRRIAQETFDAVVRENIEEFDMEDSEALKEAIEQFESQGELLKKNSFIGTEMF